MPDSAPDPIILASRSPRRLELLSLLVPRPRIEVLVPRDEREPDFAGLTTKPAVLAQLAEIARFKNDAALAELDDRPWALVLSADTVILASAQNGACVTLGKPDGDGWQERVRHWFRDYYLGRTHQVATTVCLTFPDRSRTEFTVLTEVRFAVASPELVDWYISTGEPLGKAGGYGLQGAGGMFVESVTGSLSNVIGLPLEATWRVLRSRGIL